MTRVAGDELSNFDEMFSGLNLEVRFNEDLRGTPLCPSDIAKAIEILSSKLSTATSSAEQIKLFGRIGSFQRTIGQLGEAERSFRQALALVGSESQFSKLKIANMIRLGHVHHWQSEFEKAHQLFDDSIDLIRGDSNLSEYLDFAFQHKGKCFFDQGQFEEALRFFYDAILIRSNKTNASLADSTLQAIEETKKRWLPQVSSNKTASLLSHVRMPDFVKRVLGKRHGQGLVNGRFNCINTALGFHDLAPEMDEKSTPALPIEFLKFLKDRTIQILDKEDFCFGDFMVWWNRSGGSWDTRKIVIADIYFDDPDFPYGLIFDHVGVRVEKQIVFNKPNPSPLSEYRFDFVEAAAYPSCLGRGNEVTIHRMRKVAVTAEAVFPRNRPTRKMSRM